MPSQKSNIEKNSVGTFTEKEFNSRGIIGTHIATKCDISAAKMHNKMMWC